MIKNIDQILQRGETIQELVDRTEDLESSSKVFFQNADKVSDWGCCRVWLSPYSRSKFFPVEQLLGTMHDFVK